MTLPTRPLTLLRQYSNLTILVSIAFAVLLPRWLALGSLPFTDEGYYAFYSQIIHSYLVTEHRLPDAGPLSVYPLVSAWVYATGANPLLLLRIQDAGVAIIAAYALFRALQALCHHRWLALLLTVGCMSTMNQFIFVQAGFKNSIFAAYIPLFAAYWSAQQAESDKKWLICGALVAVSVLLRETFIPFAVLGAAACMFAGGPRAWVRYTIAGLLTGLVLMGAIVWSRGSIKGLLAAYAESRIIFESMHAQVARLFADGSLAFLQHAWPLLGLSLCAALYLGWMALRTPSSRFTRPLLFLSLAALVPLIEPISKIGFPYHFAVMLPAMTGLVALAGKALLAQSGHERALISGTACLVAALVLFQNLGPLSKGDMSTQFLLARMNQTAWPEELADKSNYLFAAQQIRQHATPGASLAASGWMNALYPLTGLLPTSADTISLSATVLRHGQNVQAIQQAILACPPDLIMTTTRTDWPGQLSLQQAVEGLENYRLVTEVPVTPGRSYGDFGGRIYKASTSTACRHF